MIDAMNMICYAISHVKDVYIGMITLLFSNRQCVLHLGNEWKILETIKCVCATERKKERERKIEGVREVSFDNQHDVVINCLLSRATSCTDENMDIIPMKRNLIICEICILFYWNSIIWSNFRRMNELFSQIIEKKTH